MTGEYTVLAINDAPDQLELMQIILQQAGFRVITARSGNQGFDVARRELPDLIISDVMMPDGDGMELCRLIRADRDLQITPILLVSALRNDEQSAVDGIETGADDYLQSPFAPMLLVAKATRLIERKRTNDALRESENRFRTLIENQTDIISILAPDGKILYESPSLGTTLGYVEEGLVGKNAFDYIHPADAEKAEAYFLRTLDNPRAADMIEYRFRHENNSWRLLQSIGKRFEDQVSGTVVIINSRDITEQRKALKEKYESETRFRTIFENAAVGIAVVNPDGKCAQSNPALHKMLGYTEEELRQMPFTEYTHPDDVDKDLALATEIFEGNRDYYQLEKRYVKKNGEIVWTQLTSSVICDADDKVQCAVGMVEDITDRKQGEIALQKSEERFKRQYKSIPIPTTTWKKSGDDFVLEDFNDAAAALTKQKIIEWLGIKASEMYDNAPEIVEDFKRSYHEQTVVKREIPFRFKTTGELKHLNISCVFIPNNLLMVHYQDITEQKENEKAIAEANSRAIRDYDRLLQKLTVLAQTASAARDLQTVFRAFLKFAQSTVPCSGIYVSLYNKEKQTRRIIYLWYNDKEWDVSEYDSVAVGTGPVGQAIAAGEVLAFNDYLKAAGKKPTHVYVGYEEDSRQPRSTIIAPMKIMGNIIGTIEVQSYQLNAYTEEHITAMRMVANLAATAFENVRLLEQEKNRAEQLRQSQKLESIGRLAGGIAHDFNNMLTAINGYSGMILRQLSSDDPLRPKIEEIKKAGERSASLTQQLLAFSRQQVLKPKVLDINEVVIDTSKLLQRLIGEDVQLNFAPAHNINQIEVDPGQLTQVIVNLAVNARDAMPNGGNLTIETANVFLDENYAASHLLTKPGSYVMLAVSDNGFGMSDETLQHIFEPFYTTKEVGKGTGLGLATVYGIVKQSGGFIWVYSEIDKGTTFKIYFPRVGEEEALDKAIGKVENIPVGTETVLLVEDEEMVRNLTRQILENCGYYVIEARNGIEALEICRDADQKIDLLLTDVVMPNMGGRELAEKLIELNPEIRRLFMSGYTDDAIIRQGMITEDMNFIQKPFTFESLARKIRLVLDAN